MGLPAARRMLVASILAALVLLTSVPGIALAHALYVRSDPQPLSILPRSPSVIRIWFTEDLSSASSIVVWDRFRHVESIGHASVAPGDPREMTSAVKPLAPGAHLVLWTSVSADDGHILHGYFLFYVKKKGPGPSLSGLPSSGTETWPDAPTLVGIAAHWLELLAAVTWVGVVAFSALILSAFRLRVEEPVLAAESRRLRLLTRSAIVILILSSSALILLQAHALAGDWSGVFTGTIMSEVLSATYGKLWIGRQVLALLALLVTLRRSPFAIRRSEGIPAASSRQPAANNEQRATNIQPWPIVAGLLGLVYLYLFAASGHAASAKVWTVLGQTDISGSVIFDWFHFLGVALWFGGQIYIVLVLAPALQVRRELGPHAGVFLQALNRFSPIAYLSVAFFSLSGLFNAKIHIFSWYAFFHSVYGWTLIVKVGLVAVMMLISVLTVFGIRPRIRRVLGEAGHDMVERGAIMVGSLIGWLRVMPVLGCAVLAATSVLFYYPVPVGLAPAGPGTYTASASGITATVSIKPDHAGPNTITVMLKDSHGGPIKQATVVILETMLDMVMGIGKAQLHQTAPGTFTGIGDLGMGGRWQLEMLVFTPGGGYTTMKIVVEVST